MRRLKLFVAVASLQASFFFVRVSIDHQPARAAEAAGLPDDFKRETPHNGYDPLHNGEDTAQNDVTPRDKHETSHDEPETSHVPEAHLNVPDHIALPKPLQYPYPASADRLNKDATYALGGTLYKFVEQRGDHYIFDRVDGNGRSSFNSVAQFEVTEDPVAQVEEDMGVIPKVQKKAYDLFIESTQRIGELDIKVRNFQTTAASVHSEASEDTVRGALDAMEHHFFLIQQEVDALARYNAAIETVLRGGLNLCEDMQRRAEDLTNRLDLVNKVRALCASLHDEVNTVMVEQYDYEEARKTAQAKLETIRRAVKLASDLREVHGRFREFLDKRGSNEQELKSVVGEIEELTTKATSPEEVDERRMRARMLNSAFLTFQKQVDKLTSDAGVFIQQFQSLKPLKEMCDNFVHEDILMLNEEMRRFRMLADDVEMTARNLEHLSQRAAGALAQLKEFAESYAVMDSDLLHRGLQQVRDTIQAADAASSTLSHIELKGAEQELSGAIQSLMDAVNQGNLSALESKLQDAQRYMEAYVKAAGAAQEASDKQLETARDLSSEVRRLTAFVTSEEEKGKLEAAEALVLDRITRFEGHRRLADSTVLRERFEAAVERALVVPLDIADKRLSEGETTQARIQQLLELPLKDPATMSRLVEARHELSEQLKQVAEASTIFQNCREIAGSPGTLGKVPSGGGELLYDKIGMRWSELLKRTKRAEVALAGFTAAVESGKQALKTEIGELIKALLPHVEKLKLGPAGEDGAVEESRARSEVAESVEALKELLESANTSDFESRVQGSLVSALKAALISAAGHLQSAATAEQTAAQILSRKVEDERAEDASHELQDLPLETLAATRVMQEHISLAGDALAVYRRVQEVPSVSSSIEKLPFSGSGIAEESFPVAAQVLASKARTLKGRVGEIHRAIEAHRARMKNHLQSLLKEVLLSLDAAVQQLRSKEELATSEHQKTRIQAQEQRYVEARNTLSACMSRSTLRLKDSKACFYSFLKVIVSSAAYAAERAKELQNHADELSGSSASDVESMEKINDACNQAMEEVELSREALHLYFGSTVSTFVEAAAAPDSPSAGGTQTSLKKTAESLESEISRVVERVRELREQLQTRSTASAGMMQTTILQVLGAVRRGMEEVRILADVDPGDQKFFVDMVVDLEGMLASVPSSDEVQKKSHYQDAIHKMMAGLLALAETRLKVVEREKAQAEACVYGRETCAAPSLSEEEETLKVTCHELPQVLKLVKAALSVHMDIAEIEGAAASSDKERVQQLVTEAVTLEGQLRSLCEEATRRWDLKRQEAEQKLKMLMRVVEETLVPAITTLSQAGDPVQTATRLRQRVASFGILQATASSPLFPVEVQQQQMKTLRLLLEVVSDLQKQCNAHISKATTLLETPDPSLLLSVISQTLEEAVLGSVFRSQELADVSKSLLEAYRANVGELPGTGQEQPSDTDTSADEDFPTLPEKAKYFECAAQAEQIDAALVTVPKRLSEKVRALKEAASHVVDEVVHIGEEAIAKVEAEDAADVNPDSTCIDGEARKAQIKALLEKSIQELKTPAFPWGTEQYATTVRPAIGSLLTGVLQRAEMHVEAARKNVPAIQQCVTDGTGCGGMGHDVGAEHLIQETQLKNVIQRHAEAADQWISLYKACVNEGDTSDIVSQSIGGSSSVTLLEWEMRLSTETRGLKEMAQQLADQISLRDATFAHLIETRLQPVMSAVQKGIEVTEELLENAGDEDVVAQGIKLKEKLEHALTELQELEKGSERVASPAENQERVAGVLSMLVTHASHLVEEGIKQEQVISTCLKNPVECPGFIPDKDVGTATARVLDTLAACIKVSSLTMDVFAKCIGSRFTAELSQRTRCVPADPSSPSLLQRANYLWEEIERLEARIPVFAVEIRNQRGRDTYQSHLIQIVSLVSNGFESLNVVDPKDQHTLEEWRKRFAHLIQVLDGLHGAAVPHRVESNMREVFKMALAEAKRQVALAKENYQAAEAVLEDDATHVITAHSLATMKLSAEKAIDEGHTRATAARLLLAVMDRGADVSGKMHRTLERIADAKDLSAAEQLFEEAELCKADAHRLREKVIAREASAGNMAAASVDGLMGAIKDTIHSLEDEAVTRDIKELVESYTVRLNALLGLMEVLRQTWDFPDSLERYANLLDTCANEFLNSAYESIDAAKVVYDSAKDHVLLLRPPVNSGRAQETLKALFEQGKNLVQIASILLDGVWSALTAGEVRRPEDGKTFTVALDNDMKKKFSDAAISAAAEMAQLKEQLKLNELRAIIQSQRELVVDLATDRINHIIDSLQASVHRLADRLERVPFEDQGRRQQVTEEQQIYKDRIDTLVLYRDGPGFPTSTEELYKHIVEALSTCITNAQRNLDEGKAAMMQATLSLSTTDLSPVPGTKEHSTLQAKTTIKHASECLSLAAMALDTFTNCTHAMLVAKLADTMSDTPDGPFLQERANALLQEARELDSEIRNVKRLLANTEREETGGGEAGHELALKASDSCLTTKMAVSVGTAGSTAGVELQDIEATTADDLRRRLSSAAQHLRSADERIEEVKKCIANADDCHKVLLLDEDIPAVSHSVRVSLMGPVSLAKEDMKPFLTRVSTADTSSEETSAGTPIEGIVEQVVDEQTTRAVTTSIVRSYLSPSVRACLEWLDPSSEMTHQAEELVRATKKAEEVAVQTSMTLTAVLVLRRFLRILDEFVQRVDQEHAACKCGERDHVFFLKQECRMMFANLTELHSTFVSSPDMQEYARVVDQSMYRLLENGKLLVEVAKQAADMAVDILDEATQAEITAVTERISRVEKNVEVASHQVSLTKHLVKCMDEILKVALLLQLPDAGTLFDDLTPLIAGTEVVSNLAHRVEFTLAEIMKKLQERSSYARRKLKASIKALTRILQTTDRQLLNSSQHLQGIEAKVAAQSAKITLQALARALPAYLDETASTGAHNRFAGTVAAVGRKLLDSAEVTVDNAERVHARIIACEETGCGARLEEACDRLSEQLAVATIALRGIEACEDIGALRNILNKYKVDEKTSIIEKGIGVKGRAEALAHDLPKLRSFVFDRIHGTTRDPANQKKLLSHTITDAVRSLEQMQWLAETPHSGVNSTQKRLLNVVAELQSMGEEPREERVHAAAAKAFSLALKLASDLTEEAQQREAAISSCLSEQGDCVWTGDRAGEAAGIKKEARAVADLADMAKIALRLASLPEREKCFSEVAQAVQMEGLFVPGSNSDDATHSFTNAADALRVKAEQLYALGRASRHEALRREEDSQLECQEVMMLLSKALYTAIKDVSQQQVPKGVKKAKTQLVSRLTEAMDDLQEMRNNWKLPESLAELRPEAVRSLLVVLDTAAANIGDAEASSAKATELLKTLESHTGEGGSLQERVLATMRDVSARAGLADAALNAFYACVAHPWLRQVVTETPVDVAAEGDATEQVVAQEHGDRLLQRLKDLHRFTEKMHARVGPVVASPMEVANAMIPVLEESIRRLEEPHFQALEPPMNQKRAALVARLRALQEKAQDGTGELLEPAVAHEVTAAVLDVLEGLADTRHRTEADELADRMQELLKHLLESVNEVRTRADELVDKCRRCAEAADMESFSTFLKTAEQTKTVALANFIGAGQTMNKIQQHMALQCDYARVHHRTAKEYLAIKGVGAILDGAAEKDEQFPSTEDLLEVVHNGTPGQLLDIQGKADQLLNTLRDVEGVVAREQGKLQQAVAQVVPLYLDHLKQTTDNLVAEEELLRDQLNALVRIAANVLNKVHGRKLLAPSGVRGDVGLPNEGRMSASQLLREANARHAAFKKALRGLSSKVEEVLSQIGEVLVLVQKSATSSKENTGRRLSDAATLEAAAPILVQLKDQMYQLQNRISQMSDTADKWIKEASSGARYGTRASNRKNSEYLALALGVGLPLALLAVGGCAYYHYRRRKRKCASDLTTSGSGSELQSSARTQGVSGEFQVSRYDFVEPDGTFAAIEPAELRGLRTLTSLDTPDAGIPDTTQRQYMVDEHHVVATQMKEEAMKKEHQFEHVTL